MIKIQKLFKISLKNIFLKKPYYNFVKINNNNHNNMYKDKILNEDEIINQI